jgi:hypothetical protein
MTSGENSYKRERYAFLWKPSKVKLIGRPWLEKFYHVEINREPFLATFQANGKHFTLVNFHAITKKCSQRQKSNILSSFPILSRLKSNILWRFQLPTRSFSVQSFEENRISAGFGRAAHQPKAEMLE